MKYFTVECREAQINHSIDWLTVIDWGFPNFRLSVKFGVAESISL